jgi:hypothetical protein
MHHKIEPPELASEFLAEYAAAQKHMRAAAAALLECSKHASDPAYAALLDAQHKRMGRLITDWNQIEHDRAKDPGAGVQMADHLGQALGVDVWTASSADHRPA